MYTVKGVRSHYGMDGVATHCNVYRDGKRICEFIDNGDGGEPIVRFVNPEEERFAMEFVKDNERTKKNFKDYGASSAWDIFVEDLCNDYDQAKADRRLQKKLEKETFFRLKDEKYKEGEWRVVKSPYSPKVQEYLEKKYGTRLGEILNVKKAVPA